MFLSFYLVGSLVASVAVLAEGIVFDLPLRLLVGYGVVNTACSFSPGSRRSASLPTSVILLALATGVFSLRGERQRAPGDSASLWVVALCLVATTLWCQDSIRPTAEQDNVVLFKPWVDGFYHAVHIRIFGESHGASTIEDWRMAGVPARPYHYGMYLLPAFISRASGISSYTAFAGVLAPVGVFFTGLAAYAFFRSLWGAWPGVAAATALSRLARWRAARRAKPVHVVPLADANLAERNLWFGSLGGRLALHSPGVHAGQSMAAVHRLAVRGGRRGLQAALRGRERPSAPHRPAIFSSRGAQAAGGGPCGSSLPAQLTRWLFW